MVDHKFQRAGLALLLCAPSSLRKLWLAGDAAGVQAELTRLGFSTAAISDCQDIMATCRPTVINDVRISNTLRDDVWNGGEPHPDDPGAAAIVGQMRGLDGE